MTGQFVTIVFLSIPYIVEEMLKSEWSDDLEKSMIRPIAAAAIVAVTLTGCSTPSATTYTRQDVGRIMESTRGTVVDSRTVEIAGESSGFGAAATGIAAGVAGASTIGSGSGSVVAGALLGLMGAVVGALAEEALTSRTGVEYTVETEDGRVMTVIQNPESGEPLPAGTPVRVQFGGQFTRVIADERGSAPAGVPAPSAAPPATMTETPGTPGGSDTPSGGGGSDWINPDQPSAGASTISATPSTSPSETPEASSTRQLNVGQLNGGPGSDAESSGSSPRY